MKFSRAKTEPSASLLTVRNLTRDTLLGKTEPSTSLLTVRNLTRDTLLGNAVEVADRGAKRRKGLLGRDGLDEGGGLWIVPCEAVHTYGMRFPIDLIYLSRSRRVKKVCRSVAAWRVSACLTAHSVLELPAGTIDRTETHRGDKVELVSAISGIEMQ